MKKIVLLVKFSLKICFLYRYCNYKKKPYYVRIVRITFNLIFVGLRIFLIAFDSISSFFFVICFFFRCIHLLTCTDNTCVYFLLCVNHIKYGPKCLQPILKKNLM